MKITILCNDDLHPVNLFITSWMDKHQKHKIDLVRSKSELSYGDILFLISCSDILNPRDFLNYSKALVIHASDLPLGRGWSPHIWQIIGGATRLTITLLEVANKVDTGPIWKKVQVKVSKGALWDEINNSVFQAELSLMDFALDNFGVIEAQNQSTYIKPTYHPKRSPVDSKIDPNKSISDQFNLLRVCDPKRYPAYFELHGCKYIIRLEKSNE